MKRTATQSQSGNQELYLQIMRDLNGVQQLGRMQAELLKSVQALIEKLDRSQAFLQ